MLLDPMLIFNYKFCIFINFITLFSRNCLGVPLLLPLATHFPGFQSLAFMHSYIMLSQNAAKGAQLKMTSQYLYYMKEQIVHTSSAQCTHKSPNFHV